MLDERKFEEDSRHPICLFILWHRLVTSGDCFGIAIRSSIQPQFMSLCEAHRTVLEYEEPTINCNMAYYKLMSLLILQSTVVKALTNPVLRVSFSIEWNVRNFVLHRFKSFVRFCDQTCQKYVIYGRLPTNANRGNNGLTKSKTFYFLSLLKNELLSFRKKEQPGI